MFQHFICQKKKIHVTLSLSVYSFPRLIAKPLQENKPPSIARVFDCLARRACWFLRLPSRLWLSYLSIHRANSGQRRMPLSRFLIPVVCE